MTFRGSIAYKPRNQQELTCIAVKKWERARDPCVLYTLAPHVSLQVKSFLCRPFKRTLREENKPLFVVEFVFTPVKSSNVGIHVEGQKGFVN